LQTVLAEKSKYSLLKSKVVVSNPALLYRAAG